MGSTFSPILILASAVPWAPNIEGSIGMPDQGNAREQEKARSSAAWRDVALRMGVRLLVELVFWFLRNL
jgi:hypothetical protein